MNQFLDTAQPTTHSDDTLYYRLNFERFLGHYVDVQLHCYAPTDDPVFWMPTWIAGSYLIREFAKHVGQVRCVDDQANPLTTQKISKNHWQIHAKKGQALTISYAVYCRDLSVRCAYVDDTRIFVNFSALLLLHSDGQALCHLQLVVPQAFFARNPNAQLVSGLDFVQTGDRQFCYYDSHSDHASKPLRCFELLDYPTEIAPQQHTDFVVWQDNNPITHRFFVSGVCTPNLTRLQQDLQAICQAYVNWLGYTPFTHYTFMTHATLGDYGGLEHINSTALITPRDDLRGDEFGSASYQRFLGLCSHEYFHSWWVKSVRPDVMMDSQLQTEAYTPLLWIFEGFTSYIDDLMLYHAGVIDEAAYLTLFGTQISRYQNTQGRHHQSVAESSFDTWIKLYRPDENSQNSTVSYYNKGALVAFGIDVLLMAHGLCLFDVIKQYTDLAKTSPNTRFGLSDTHWDSVMAQCVGEQIWADFRLNYIDGTTPLPLQAWLGSQGIKLNYQHKPSQYGISYEKTPAGLVIKHIISDSSAVAAALAVGDVIVAIDGLKACDKALQYHAAHKHDISVHIFRGDILKHCQLLAQDDADTVHNVQLRRYKNVGGWLDKAYWHNRTQPSYA